MTAELTSYNSVTNGQVLNSKNESGFDQINGKDHHHGGSIFKTDDDSMLPGIDLNIPDSEATKTETKTNTVSLLQLYRYCDKFDVLLIVVGTLGALLAGMATPLNLFIYGDVIEIFVTAGTRSTSGLEGMNATTLPPVNIVDAVSSKLIYFAILALAAFICSYFAISCWSLTAERQSCIIRKEYFRAILRQEIAWFDLNETGELNSRLASDIHTISECMGDKIAIFLQFVSVAIGGYTLALVLYWKLALVCLAFSPLILIIVSAIGRKLRGMSAEESNTYSQAGAVAEEALRNIRTVQAFQGQEKEAKRYEDKLKKVDTLGAKKGLTLGVAESVLWTILFLAFSVSFWYGVRLYQDENLDVGQILPVFFGVMLGSIYLGNAFPYLETISKGRGAAENIFKVIDAKPSIDVFSDKGDKPPVEGNIAFKQIDFAYPSRPNVQVLKNMNLQVDSGMVVALVGPSGSGKSTVVQLIQRFYDPSNGQVLIDGKDIREFNVKYLREQIGIVSQEPVLFSTTIEENIRYGSLDVNKSDIIQAATAANAHDFITELPEGYGTLVGERGARLSGGQKQRIAIARALVRNPKILLLDEATSALDHESEAIVQSALEKVQAGRTTIVIAHRLSTIKNADMIAVVDCGGIKELGNHESLMSKGGMYYNLVETQINASKGHRDEDDVSKDADADLKDLGELAIPIKRSASLIKQLKSEDSADADNESKVESNVPTASFTRVIQLNSPEWILISFGTFASFMAGFNHPAFAFFISEYIRVFAIQDREEQLELSNLLSLIFGGIALFMFLVRIVQNYCLTVAGTRLTSRIRKMVFRSYLKQDMEFYDIPTNEVGALTTKLASDAALVQGATGSKIGTVVETITLLLVALSMAFYYSWKLSLVILAFIPVLIGSGIIQKRMISGFSKNDSSNLDNAGKVCSEAVDNIRTIASLTREDIFLSKYGELIETIKRNSRKKALLYGIFYALAQSVLYCAYAATFAYGSIMVQDGEIEFYAVFRIFSAIIFGGMVVGRQSAYSMDYGKAKIAAGRLFTIIDRKPKIDSTATSGKTLDRFKGHLSIRGVEFNYPSRPEATVLSGFNLDIEPGQTVALVGHSGCGKSTTVHLVLRFYDPVDGAVNVEGVDIRNVNIQWLRSQIGIVSQEPLLFNTSIYDNIAYGDNSRVVSMVEVIAAARSANIHNFIESLPEGYETGVGDKGSQLSGGQKQRIAIARALIRNPKILLLDEATSALDTQSEQIVQEALDKARSGRTCIVIAHRLSTIQSADKIILIRHGKMEESGTHLELLELKGYYYRLHQAQNREKKT